jgi:hypothetical protein
MAFNHTVTERKMRVEKTYHPKNHYSGNLIFIIFNRGRSRTHHR